MRSAVASDPRIAHRRLVAALFVAAGLAHFVMPAFFEAIVPPWLPRWLPSPRVLVYLSGAAELAGGLGVLVPSVRVAAGWGLLALLLGVFPANVHMLLEALTTNASVWWIVALIVRLPMQPLLMWWVWRATRRTPSRTP